MRNATTTAAAIAATVKCADCGRKLTAPASVAARRGPTCRARVAYAIKFTAAVGKLNRFKPEQVTKALEIIDLAAITRVRRTTTWIAVSSKGDTTYSVDIVSRSCTCPAGTHGVRCYHLAAADILVAA